MDKHTELKPCPFCGYKNAKISERRNRINGGRYFDDMTFHFEVVIKISANVMCNCCHAKGGTAVGFIECNLFPPSERMKRTFNVEPITAIWKRAEDKWNRRANLEKESKKTATITEQGQADWLDGYKVGFRDGVVALRTQTVEKIDEICKKLTEGGGNG